MDIIICPSGVYREVVLIHCNNLTVGKKAISIIKKY